jgi:hypothetical protein
MRSNASGGETPPVLILQLRPEKITADSEYACFLKYGQLKAEDTFRIGIMKTEISIDLDIDDYSAIIVGQLILCVSVITIIFKRVNMTLAPFFLLEWCCPFAKCLHKTTNLVSCC